MLREDFVSIDREGYEEAAFKLKKALHINPGYFFARSDFGVLYEDRILQITLEGRHIQKRLEGIS